MASNEPRQDSDVGTIAVQALAERISTLAHTRLANLVGATTDLLDDDDSVPLSPEVKGALTAYASRFFEDFETDVAAEILEYVRAGGLDQQPARAPRP